MKALDGRHRWDSGRRVLMEPRIVYTCLACGRTQSFELIVPDSVVEALMASLPHRNPYREMFAKVALR